MANPEGVPEGPNFLLKNNSGSLCRAGVKYTSSSTSISIFSFYKYKYKYIYFFIYQVQVQIQVH